VAPTEFSIVIPTYNRAHLIRRTIESVLAQDDPDFELIVVDDGGSDDTEGVVRSFADGRIAYHRKVHGERGAARNFGAARATGRYVNFLDSDDLLLSHHLSTARRLAERQSHPEVFHLGFEVRDDEGRLLRRANPISGDPRPRLLRENILTCHSVFLRRDIALRLPFLESLSGAEDWELWLRVASRYPLYYSNEVTSVLVHHAGRSVLHMDEASMLRNKEAVLAHLSADEPFMRAHGRRSLHMVESELLSYMALHLAMNGARGPACKYLKDSLLARPASLFRRRFLAVIKRIVLGCA
jgi:glycosyltransferase involved in cell wall biosynthesis